MASGNAVHYAIEQHCRNRQGEIPQKADVDALIFESLDDQFKGDDKKIDKYTPGVRRALTKVPEWVWTTAWYLEHDVEGQFCSCSSVNNCPSGGDASCQLVQLWGRPDTYHVSEEFVELVDFKTTATNPLQFLLWTPQLRYYAAILKQMYPDKLVRYRYMCLPTQGTGPAPTASPWPFKKSSYDRTVAEIVRFANEIDVETSWNDPFFSRACDWCDFNSVCIADITGADTESMKKEEYHERGRH